jgi:hypothetical protein
VSAPAGILPEAEDPFECDDRWAKIEGK